MAPEYQQHYHQRYVQAPDYHGLQAPGSSYSHHSQQPVLTQSTAPHVVYHQYNPGYPQYIPGHHYRPSSQEGAMQDYQFHYQFQQYLQPQQHQFYQQYYAPAMADHGPMPLMARSPGGSTLPYYPAMQHMMAYNQNAPPQSYQFATRFHGSLQRPEIGRRPSIMPPLVNISPPLSYKKQWLSSASKGGVEPVQKVGFSKVHCRSKSIPGAGAPVRSCFEGTKKQKWGSWLQNGPSSCKEANQFPVNGSSSASQQSSDSGVPLRRATSYTNVECRPDIKAPGTSDQGTPRQIQESLPTRIACSENYPRTQHSNAGPPGNFDCHYPVDYGNYGRSANGAPCTWEFGFDYPPAPGAVGPSGAWDQRDRASSTRSVVSQTTLSEEGEAISIADKHTATTNVSISDFRLNPEARSFDLVGEPFKQCPQPTDLDIPDDDNYAGFYLLSDPQNFYQAPQMSTQPQHAIDPSPGQPTDTIDNRDELANVTEGEVVFLGETAGAVTTEWAEEVESSLAFTESESELPCKSPIVCVLPDIVASVGLCGETERDALVPPDEATPPREKETIEASSDSQSGSMKIGDGGIAISTDRVISSEDDNEGTLGGESSDKTGKDTSRQNAQPQALDNGQAGMGEEKPFTADEQTALADELAVTDEKQIVTGGEQITAKVEQSPRIGVWNASERGVGINRKEEIPPSNEPMYPGEKSTGGENEVTLEGSVALDEGKDTKDEIEATSEKQIVLEDKITSSAEPPRAETEVASDGQIIPDEKQTTPEENQVTAAEKQMPECYSDDSSSQKPQTKGAAAGTAFSYRDILLGNISSGPSKAAAASTANTVPPPVPAPPTQAAQKTWRKFFLRPLPPDTSCDSLVKQIRGGMLEEIFISNFSIKSKTGQNGGYMEANDNFKKDDFAHISFYSEEGAKNFWDQVQGGLFEPGANSPNGRLKRGSDDTFRTMTFGGCRVMVSWRNRDQEPPPLAISEAVEKHGATRCLVVTFHKNKYIEGTMRNLQGKPVASWNNDSPTGYREECLKKIKADMRSWTGGVQFQRIDALMNEQSDSPKFLILFLGISTAIAFKRYFEIKNSYKGRCKVEFYGDECATLREEGTPPAEGNMNKSATNESPVQKAIPVSSGATQNGDPPKAKKSNKSKKRQRAKKAELSSD